MTRRWFITGCSTGLGRALADEVASSGQRVFATARRPETLDDLRAAYPDLVATFALDVRDPDACRRAVDAALDRFGGVDVLVNNAGYGQFGTVEEVTDAELEAQFATNVFAPWRLARLLLPHLRAQGSGDIVMVSSTAARVAYPGLSAYTAAKFALEGLVEALAADLDGTGIGVMAVQPGMFATEWGSSCAEPGTRIEAYREVVTPMQAGTRALKSLPMAGPPAAFAAELVRLIASDRRLRRQPIGADSWQTALTTTEQARADLLAAHAERSDPVPA